MLKMDLMSVLLDIWFHLLQTIELELGVNDALFRARCFYNESWTFLMHHDTPCPRPCLGAYVILEV